MLSSIKTPWRIARDTFGCLRIWDAEGTMITGIHEDEWDDQTVNEHANLIVAAPVLLAACEAMLNAQSARRHPLGAPDEGIAAQCAEAASKARAAISKARGQ